MAISTTSFPDASPDVLLPGVARVIPGLLRLRRMALFAPASLVAAQGFFRPRMA